MTRLRQKWCRFRSCESARETGPRTPAQDHGTGLPAQPGIPACGVIDAGPSPYGQAPPGIRTCAAVGCRPALRMS